MYSNWVPKMTLFFRLTYPCNFSTKQKTNSSSTVMLYVDLSQRNYLPRVRNITGLYFGRFM